ncbi:MAG: maltose alpha-D-glucosyltransferase [Acidimicrobiales bacterium]
MSGNGTEWVPRPEWYRDAVIYQTHVRAFADSNGDGIGDFTGLTGKLDYLAEDLGVTALWVMPFYPSPLRDDGYDIADYNSINPSYGDMRSFRRFLAAAHERGIHVIGEMPINHTSDQHPWFQRARTAPPGSRERNYYVWSDTTDLYTDARIIFEQFEPSNWSWDPVAEAYYWHRFYHHQPDLNFESADVRDEVFKAVDYWFAMGVDGLRLDAIPYLFEEDGTNCENLPQTHAFLKDLRAHVDAKFANRMFLAEANQWPEDAAAYFGEGDECHMNFHFPVMPRLYMGVQMENRTPIVDILEQTPATPPGCQWATFLRNHDELTLEMVTDEERDYMVRAYAHDPEMRINLGIRRRLAPLLGNDRSKIELLNALLFSLPGTPVVYYGDEIGMGDNVYLGDRDGVRTPMQWTPDRNAGFSTANPHKLFLPVITEPGYHYENVNVEAQLQNPGSLLRWTRQLIALRKRYPVLGRGDITFLDPENPRVLAFVRTMEGSEPFMVVANLSRLSQHVELDLREWINHVPTEVFGQTPFPSVGELPWMVTLAPHGFFWFSLVPPDPAEADLGGPPLIPGTWPDVVRSSGGRLARALRRWIVGQRWFAGKGRPISELHVDDVVQFPDDVAEAALVVVRVAYTDGDPQRYAVPLARLTGDRATSVSNLHPGAVVASLDDDAVLVDAMVDETSVAAVVRTARSRRQLTGRKVKLRGRPTRLLGNLGDDVRLVGVEQSNTSAIIDSSVIAKLIRRIEPGENPDIELPTALADAGFAHSPRVAGAVEMDLPGESEPAVLMALHSFEANEGDVWNWSQDELSRLYDRLAETDDTAPAGPEALAGLGGRAEPRGNHADAVGPALDVAGLLGTRIAEMHAALAPLDGGPKPFAVLYQRSLVQTLRAQLRSTQRELKRAKDLTEEAASLAARVIDDGELLLERTDALRARKLEAARIRVHGDLHLGQILWTGRDVVIIDYEGEPNRPLSERRIKRSPVADVAGVLRSFDYAPRVALATALDRGLLHDSDVPRMTGWAHWWTAWVQRRFLSSYSSTIADAGLVPTDTDDFALLVDTYVLEKALYEVRYELGARPDWVSWPLAALVEIIDRAER